MQDRKNDLRQRVHAQNGAAPDLRGHNLETNKLVSSAADVCGGPCDQADTQAAAAAALSSRRTLTPCVAQLISKKGRFEAWRLDPLPQELEAQQAQVTQSQQSVDDPTASGDDWATSLSSKALSKFARSQRNTARRREPVQPDAQDLFLNERGSLVFSGALLRPAANERVLLTTHCSYTSPVVPQQQNDQANRLHARLRCIRSLATWHLTRAHCSSLSMQAVCI